MPGLVPGIHAELIQIMLKTWMAGSSPAITITHISTRRLRRDFHFWSRK
jgi:hypothetical protein